LSIVWSPEALEDLEAALKALASERAKQCLSCGADWHNEHSRAGGM
jgi:hypothetical protein